LKKPSVLFIAVLLLASLLACADKKGANQKADAEVKILATVNGVPITEYDLKQILRRVPTGEGMHPEVSHNMLQTLVRDEIIYQKSLELGLDKNPEYRRKLHEVEAQLRAFQRQEMSARYLAYVRSKAEVTDAEAQAYFEKNAKLIQTRYHVWQILYRGKDSQIAKDHQDLKSGMPFEKVALRRFPNLPKEVKAPWDIGYLHWSQIPQPWQDIVDRMTPGQVSDIIKGPNDRFWVIKLVDKTVDPKITFATEKERIVEVLRKQKADKLSDDMLNEMRAKAEIVSPK
jgi:EpsD family peptidyl-prolyl cis-trans isomerase